MYSRQAKARFFKQKLSSSLMYPDHQQKAPSRKQRGFLLIGIYYLKSIPVFGNQMIGNAPTDIFGIDRVGFGKAFQAHQHHALLIAVGK